MALAMSTMTIASVMQEPITMSAMAHCGRLSESENGPICAACREKFIRRVLNNRPSLW